MKVLVTGGAGFIGSHLVDRLIQNGHEVTIIDDLSGGYRRNLNPKAKFFQRDLREYKPGTKNGLYRLFRSIKPEVIFHLAANAAENKSQYSPIEVTTSNYNSFLNTLVLSIMNGCKRFVFTSSIAVYGAIKTPFKETSMPRPKDLYGIVKLASEQTLKIMSKVHGFEFVIVRPHNVYGPRQNMSDPYRNVITLFMNSLLKGEPFIIYGDGNQRRCFSYIDDVVDALYKCGFEKVSGLTFNIGSDKNYTVNALSEVILRTSGIDSNPIYLRKRQQEVKNALSDHELSKKLLGYKDKTSLAEGIRKTWKYAKRLGPQKTKYTEIELPNVKMPANWRLGN